MYEPTIALSGHLGGDPELRFTPNGTPVCDLRVATTPRRKNGDEWEDRETLWFKVSCWKALAEHVAASFKKGDRVLVQGRLLQQSYERRDGSTGTSLLVDAGLVGADVSRYPIEVKRPVRADSSAHVLTDRWVDQSTGEVLSSPVAGLDDLVPLEDEDEVAA